ncbi:hypothetical protein, partial [Lactococcus taiwanensis]|uniref:hypothetical protein n=1 Tax=Lactococcus taiwanensis TaxID=1151742 RepID=UPI0035193EF8
DVAKSGNTVVTYEGAPKPAEWGLSVPATLNLNKNDKKWYFNNAKVAILDSTGGEYSGKTPQKFIVSGTSSVVKNDKVGMTADPQKNNYLAPLNMYVANQGDNEPASPASGSFQTTQTTNTLQNIEFDSSKGKVYKYIQFALWKDDLTENDQKKTLSSTISWTASEKTP